MLESVSSFKIILSLTKRTTMRLMFLAIFCAGVLVSCSQAQKPEDDFEAIRQLVCEGHYQQAIPKLMTYNGKHNSRAGLFLGKAHMGLGDLASARAAFESTIAMHPQTDEAHKSRYKLALLSYLEGDTVAAKAAFMEMSANPDGPLVAEAAAFARFLAR